MGEYADMAIDDMMSYDYHQMNGDFDDPHYNPFTGGWRHKPRPQTCKRCGHKGLWWGHYPEGWRLEEGIHVETPFGEHVEFVKHECQLGFKGAFAKMQLDSDPDTAYNAYLDTIPWE